MAAWRKKFKHLPYLSCRAWLYKNRIISWVLSTILTNSSWTYKYISWKRCVMYANSPWVHLMIGPISKLHITSGTHSFHHLKDDGFIAWFYQNIELDLDITLIMMLVGESCIGSFCSGNYDCEVQNVACWPRTCSMFPLGSGNRVKFWWIA